MPIPVHSPFRGEAQQLRPREVLAYDDFAAIAQTHHMKLVFPKPMPIVCMFMERSLTQPSSPQNYSGMRAADHPIS
jgi:hypothetical protein